MAKVQIKKIDETDFESDNLTFKLLADGDYLIENKDPESIGYLEKIRVGRFMHWCLLLESGCYLSPGCMDEVREMQRRLGSKKNKKP